MYPKLLKNLPSVSRFTNDNNILIEFDSYTCYIKDEATGELLDEGWAV